MQPNGRQETPVDPEQLIRAGQAAAHRWRMNADSSGFEAAGGICEPNAGTIENALAIAGYQVAGAVRRGGQSVVYEAIQCSTRRTVAVKLFHAHGDNNSENSLRRFEYEASLLTELHHPHIVTVHDVGLAGDRRYIVMDFVDGRPIDEYVAAVELPLRELLNLFGSVCDGVNAAHLKGVIHRDLKPSNILVREGDATPAHPIVLDFGLAKRDASFDSSTVDQQLHSETITHAGQFVGSLPWASPEQAAGNSATIDIRTDVYSLGVILYKLLAGRFPYDVSGPTRDVLNRIVIAEPARLTLNRETRSPILRRRRTKTYSRIDSDLDTIVLKCLSKEPARRYANAGELARDIRRYLASEPIEAKRDRIGYVARKFIARHRALAVTFFLLMGSTVASGFVFFKLWRAAELARADSAIANSDVESLSQILQSTADAEVGAIEPRTVVAGLRNLILRWDARGSFPSELSLRTRAAHIFTRMKSYEDALGQFRHALRIVQTSHNGHEELALLTNCAEIERLAGRPEAALDYLTRALERNGDSMTLTERASLLIERAMVLRSAGQSDAAEADYQEIFSLPLRDGTALLGMRCYCDFLSERGRNWEAAALESECISYCYATNNWIRLALELQCRAVRLGRDGCYRESEAIAKEGLGIAHKYLIDDPQQQPRVMVLTRLVGLSLLRQHRFAEAEPFLRKAQEGYDSPLDKEYQRQLIEDMATLHEEWAAVAPGVGHAEECARWRERLTE